MEFGNEVYVKQEFEGVESFISKVKVLFFTFLVSLQREEEYKVEIKES